jgi:hypothetical protein
MATKTATKTATKSATPWGRAELVAEVTVRQQAGERRFASVVQLLETADGERLVRFAYSTGGVARRGPVTLRHRDVTRLHELLAKCPELSEALGL